VAGFCNQRGLPTRDIRIIEHIESDPTTGMVTKIGLSIQLPPDFPEKYREAIIRAADQCAVKKHIEHPPIFEIDALIGQPT
jgi:ribosomal protein S12 methylthiotransferase accessory factor